MREFGLLGGEFLAHAGHRMQHGFIQLMQHMELAHLMRNGAKNSSNCGGIESRPVSGHRAHAQAAGVQDRSKLLEESQHILWRGIVIEHLVVQTLEGTVVHNGKYTERPIIEFVSG